MASPSRCCNGPCMPKPNHSGEFVVPLNTSNESRAPLNLRKGSKCRGKKEQQGQCRRREEIKSRDHPEQEEGEEPSSSWTGAVAKGAAPQAGAQAKVVVCVGAGAEQLPKQRPRGVTRGTATA